MKIFSTCLLALYGLSHLAYAEETPKQEAQKTLNTIIISSSRIEEPLKSTATAITVLTQEDIEKSGQSNLADLLRTTPGIGVSNAGGIGKTTALRIRGEEGYRTLVMLDGVDVSDPTGTQVGPQIQHLLLGKYVDRVEVLRGPQGFIYGADVGGVVNILSPRGEGDLSGSIHTEIGSYNTHSLSTFLSASNETGDFFLSYSNIDTEGFNARESDSDKDKDGYQNTTIHSKLGFNVNDQSRLQWVTHRVEGENEYDDCFGSDDCESAFNHLINKISLNIDLENIQHHVAYSVTDVDRRFFADGEAGYQTEGSVKRFEYLSHYDVGTSTLIAGFDTEKEQVGDDERSQLGSYIEYKIEPLRNLFLAAGVRRDDHDDFGLHFSQRASVAYTFEWDTLDLRLRSSYGTGFRAPSLSEVALNEDSEPLEEETSTGYEAGFDLIFNNGTELQFTYFDQQIEDEIYYDMTSFYYLQDAGESKSSGAEIFAQVPLGSNWALATNYTYNDTEDSDGDQRARRPKHQGNVSFSYYNDDNTVTSALNLRGAKDAVDIDDDKLAGYVVADFSLSYEVNYQVKLSASVKNLLDKDYEEVRGFNTSDRAYYFGAQIDL